MDPITLGVVGVALYGWWKGRGTVVPQSASGVPQPSAGQLAVAPASATAANQPISTAGSGTDPAAPLATATTVVTQTPLAAAMTAPAIPADLVAALDDQTALAFRDYAIANPDDFQMWLNRYAASIQLRDNLYFQAITNPPPGGYQVTPQMTVSMGVGAIKVAQALNGVAAGNYGDLFGAASAAAGALPNVPVQLIQTIQGLTLGYKVVSSFVSLADLAAANGVTLTTLFTSPASLAGAVGAYPGLAAVPLAGVLMAVGLCIDIGFTIAGNEPDVQKAIDVALDAASIAVLFIPVIGVVIAVIIQLVKFIIDCFGGDLFGGGLTHAQREALETARYSQYINPMYSEIATALTPRELFRVCVSWGSAYCGGLTGPDHMVAMGLNLILRAGDTLTVGGQPYTVPSDVALPIVAQPCYSLQGTPFQAITNDEIAWAMGMYGPQNGITANAQAGISAAHALQFDDPTENLLAVRTMPMRNILIHGVSLDQYDQIVLEYRAQPGLNELAGLFGQPDWPHLFAEVVAAEWSAFSINNTHGSLADFATQNGYPSMFAFRAAALASRESYHTNFKNALNALQNPNVGAPQVVPLPAPAADPAWNFVLDSSLQAAWNNLLTIAFGWANTYYLQAYNPGGAWADPRAFLPSTPPADPEQAAFYTQAMLPLVAAIDAANQQASAAGQAAYAVQVAAMAAGSGASV